MWGKGNVKRGKGRLASGNRNSRREERGRGGGRQIDSEADRENQRPGETDREGQRKRKMGSGKDPFKREHSECAQEMLLVAAAEDIACQNPVQILNTKITRIYG